MLVFLFRLLSRIPLPAMHLLGSFAGQLIYRISPRYRLRLEENIQQAGFSADLSSAVREAGKNLFELPFIWCAPQPKVLDTVQVENWQLVDAAMARGHGIIFLTPHLGCFEVIAQIIADRMPLTALYRPPRKKALTPLIEGARRRANLALAPANLGGVRTLLKTLKRGGAIGLLPDQVPQQGDGVWANFFGKPAYTMTLPAKLQRMTDAPLVLSFAQRLSDGKGFLVRFASFDDHFNDDPTEQANAINRAMEQLIAGCPSQYFWSYNRYKSPSRAAPHPLTESPP